MRGVERKARSGWEQARYIAYYCMKPWAKEGFSMEDMVNFPWEREGAERPMTEKEEREEEKRILTKMAIIEKQLQQRHGKQ